MIENSTPKLLYFSGGLPINSHFIIYSINSPALLKSIKVEHFIENKLEDYYVWNDMYVYPNAQATQLTNISVDKHKEIRQKAFERNKNLIRLITIEYTAFQKDKIYQYKITHELNKESNFWIGKPQFAT